MNQLKLIAKTLSLSIVAVMITAAMISIMPILLIMAIPFIIWFVYMVLKIEGKS